MKSKRTIVIISLGVGIAIAAVVMLNRLGHSQYAFGQSVMPGRVISNYGPVENARVRVPGDHAYTLADRQGRFSLKIGHVPWSRFRITAGKEGWFNNMQIVTPQGGSGDILLNPVPRNDQPYYRFTSPEVCARCHVKVTQYWEKSKMAHF